MKEKVCVDCGASLAGRAGRIQRCYACAKIRQAILVKASVAKRAAKPESGAVSP